MITLDTSGFLALINRKDREHAACLEVFEADGGPYYLPAGILSEIGWFMEERFRRLLGNFLADLRDGAYQVDWGPLDLNRLGALVQKYGNLPLSIADAIVILTAERHGGEVLAVDKHFGIVARDPGVEITVRP